MLRLREFCSLNRLVTYVVEVLLIYLLLKGVTDDLLDNSQITVIIIAVMLMSIVVDCIIHMNKNDECGVRKTRKNHRRIENFDPVEKSIQHSVYPTREEPDKAGQVYPESDVPLDYPNADAEDLATVAG